MPKSGPKNLVGYPIPKLPTHVLILTAQLHAQYPFIVYYICIGRNGGRGLGPVAKREILQRTLGDVMCEVSTLDLVQKWVTLQPNTEYNDYETCLSKKRIAMREIADEIAFELGTKGKFQK